MFAYQGILVCLLFTACCGQNLKTSPPQASTNLHHGLTEKIGNFSVELLYFTAAQEAMNTNLIMSPVTAWSLLASISEGATGNTLKEICNILRIVPSKRDETRRDFKNIFQYLQVRTNTVDLARYNVIFVDERRQLLRDFVDVVSDYDSRVIPSNFTNSDETARLVNNAVSNVTHGRISSIITGDDLKNSMMVMTSVLYFKGQWTAPFNATQTTKQPFYSSSGEKIGEVNMMYNRHNYPFANIKHLQARVIEIPYGQENRLSMLVMLPYAGVSLKDMINNFNNVTLDTVFNELKISSEEYSDDEVDCFLPRFKIESQLDLTNALQLMGIQDLFDETRASLALMSLKPLYVTKVTHKAEIEVTEEGTTASAASTAEFSNRIGVIRFEVNRPFCYLIVEKVTNSIAFGGFYQLPSLY